jgi:MFS family permease
LTLVFVLAFLGLGFFNGFTTLLEPLLAPNGVNAEQGGLVGAMMIVGGIAGSVVIPALSDKLRRRKPFVLACTAVAASVLWPLCSSRQLAVMLVLAAVLGFFFLPAYALLLEMCSELAGRESAGYATGVLMLAGNLGGVVMITAMQLLRGAAGTYQPAIWLLLGALLVALVLASAVRETFGR